MSERRLSAWAVGSAVAAGLAACAGPPPPGPPASAPPAPAEPLLPAPPSAGSTRQELEASRRELERLRGEDAAAAEALQEELDRIEAELDAREGKPI